jgi:hypothetical protein
MEGIALKTISVKQNSFVVICVKSWRGHERMVFPARSDVQPKGVSWTGDAQENLEYSSFQIFVVYGSAWIRNA